MSDTTSDRIDTALLREIAEAASQGPWGVRYFEDDHLGEVRRFAEALRLSLDHQPDTGAVCWRLVLGGPNACNGEIADAETDDEWFNLAFMGNGPSSEVNSIYIANVAPSVVLALLDELDALRAAVGSDTDERTP